MFVLIITMQTLSFGLVVQSFMNKRAWMGLSLNSFLAITYKNPRNPNCKVVIYNYFVLALIPYQI